MTELKQTVHKTNLFTWIVQGQRAQEWVPATDWEHTALNQYQKQMDSFELHIIGFDESDDEENTEYNEMVTNKMPKTIIHSQTKTYQIQSLQIRTFSDPIIVIIDLQSGNTRMATKCHMECPVYCHEGSKPSRIQFDADQITILRL